MTEIGVDSIQQLILQSFAPLRNSQSIIEGHEYHMGFDGTTARLKIKPIKSEMSGIYKCRIQNEFGEEESDAELSVIGNLFCELH